MNHGADIAAGRFAHHGGRLCVARSLFPDAPEPWIDLSTGINPHSYPAPRASAGERNRLPEPTELARLEALAAAAFGVADPSRVVATGGTESAIRLLPYVLKQATAVVAGPTYSSHADAWKHAGADTVSVDDQSLLSRAESRCALTVVNPNNPDGRLMGRAQLQTLHDRLLSAGGSLIVDEAFGDLQPADCVANIAGSDVAPNMVVLRSFGKFYGLAGVRLGFVIGTPALASQLRRLLGDWPISADALRAGIAAYADGEWAIEMRTSLLRSAQRLDESLVRAGMSIVGGTSLYRLARAADARARFTRLMSQGVLARPFDYDATLLRFGLPSDKDGWRRLSLALEIRP